MRCFYKKWIRAITYPLFLCLILNIRTLSFGQETWTFDQQELKIYEDILALKTIDAKSKVTRNRNTTLYLDHLKNTIELLISGNKNDLSEYEKKTDKILSHYKKQKTSSPFLKFYIAETLLRSAFVHLKLGHEITAGWELKKSYQEININIKSYPNFLPQYKTIGLLNVIISSIPDKYNWLLSILGMNGSVYQGISKLSTLSESENVFNTEATLLILLIEGYILQETTKSIKGLEQLYQNNNDNLLIGYLYVSVLIKSQKNEIALDVLNSLKALQNENYIKFSLLNYLVAETHLKKGSYTQAIDNYQSFIDIHDGDNYLKDAHYKMGLAYWFQNQPKLATSHFETAKNIGETLTEADKHAEKQLNNDKSPNLRIMKARLLTDGGYYEKALKILENIRLSELTSKKDQVEINYRKARIYHQTDRLNAAIAFYKLTINNVEKSDWYFTPNAALQLGFIYQSEGSMYLAEKYFKKALSYKGHEYKNSIDNKAKSGLSSLKNSLKY